MQTNHRGLKRQTLILSRYQQEVPKLLQTKICEGMKCFAGNVQDMRAFPHIGNNFSSFARDAKKCDKIKSGQNFK